MSFMEREAHHVAGFSPELAVVTHGGGELLEEPLAVRPTSETIIGYSFAKWIKSYRDLPLLVNQWANVVRWEMRTRLFLRTLEFYWQEGHTAHATAEEAEFETRQMLEVYTRFAYDEAAVPVIPGLKTPAETFAGADHTYSIEAMMGDTKALQSGTSHNLGQNFARAFDIQYLDVNNTLQYCWTTSWGLSTRFIGAIIMTHGDDNGLMLPPRLAPIQIVIVPIARNDEERSRVMEVVDQLKKRLVDFRIKVDDRTELTPGFKYHDWEMRGVPLRIEIGPRDVDQGVVTVARRDIPGKAGKITLPMDGLEQTLKLQLEEVQKAMLARATAFRDANIHDPKDYAAFREVVENGWAFSWWCGSSDCEVHIKEETKATARNIPLDQPEGHGRCIYCGQPASQRAYFAKAY
jgi:prolyl-tRNA synthetase